MRCTACGEEILECLVAYDFSSGKVTHTWPEVSHPDRRLMRDLSRTFPLEGGEILMVGEPVVRDKEGRPYHVRCYHGG
jgi:hypothetical protein